MDHRSLGPETERSKAHETVLEVHDLEVEFVSGGGVRVKAVRGISYSLVRGRTLAIVGESGSGKTVSSLAVMGLVGYRGGSVTGGRAEYRGTNLLALDQRAMQQIRGRRIGMVFQDALSSLNPVYPVGDQVSEMFRMHQGMGRAESKRRAIDVLSRVEIPNAAERYRDYPHEFSGGMRQRVMIAAAIALEPEVLIADEPTTALDVTVQAQILELLRALQSDLGLSIVLITHDLGVVADMADDVVLMYAGQVVESGPARSVLAQPAHPYTAALMRSVPNARVGRAKDLVPIPGLPPNLAHIPHGCAFHPRCEHQQSLCQVTSPQLTTVPGSDERRSACHYYEEVLERSKSNDRAGASK